MTSAGLGACEGGGWTLVMKIDGTKVHIRNVMTVGFSVALVPFPSKQKVNHVCKTFTMLKFLLLLPKA